MLQWKEIGVNLMGVQLVFQFRHKMGPTKLTRPKKSQLKLRRKMRVWRWVWILVFGFPAKSST